MRINSVGFIAALIISTILAVILSIFLHVVIGAIAIGVVLFLPIAMLFSRKRTHALTGPSNKSIAPK